LSGGIYMGQVEIRDPLIKNVVRFVKAKGIFFIPKLEDDYIRIRSIVFSEVAMLANVIERVLSRHGRVCQMSYITVIEYKCRTYIMRIWEELPDYADEEGEGRLEIWRIHENLADCEDVVDFIDEEEDDDDFEEDGDEDGEEGN
jgi:hypothetical protein